MGGFLLEMTSAGYSEKWPWQISSSLSALRLGMCKLKTVQLQLQMRPNYETAVSQPCPGPGQLLAAHSSLPWSTMPCSRSSPLPWDQLQLRFLERSPQPDKEGKGGNCWMTSWFKMFATLLLTMSLFPSLSLFPTVLLPLLRSHQISLQLMINTTLFFLMQMSPFSARGYISPQTWHQSMDDSLTLSPSQKS